MTALKYIPNYRVSDYQSWEGDWELWDGIPVAMSPSPFGIHQWAATSFAASIKNQLDDQGCNDCYVLMELDWIVSDRTVVRPDVAVCCGKFPERFIESAPLLIIEVLSESTAEKDRTSKRELYQSLGVQHYLIHDPVTERLQGFQLVNGVLAESDADKPICCDFHDDCGVELTAPRRK
jgi:Uma2 family endonuclease